MTACNCTAIPAPTPTTVTSVEKDVTVAIGLEWPAFDMDMGGSVGVGLMLSVIGNIVNGIGYVTQNVGHHKTGARKCLYREMKNYAGDEQTRLEQILEEGLLKDCGPVGEQAEELAKLRLDEIKRAGDGSGKLKPNQDEGSIEAEIAAGPNQWTNPIWVTGFVIYAAGSLCNAAALGFAPAALIAPLDGLTLVTNAIVAPLVLPESLRFIDVIGISIIMAGVALCVLFGPSNDTEWTVEDLVKQWGNTAMIVYTIMMVTITYGVYRFCKWKVASLIEAGDYDDNSGEHMDLQKGFYVGLGYCWIAGTLAAYNGLFTSAWSTALSSSFSSGTNYYSIDAACVSTAYLQVIAFVLANSSMEYWKQRSLCTFDSIFIVPVFQVLLVVLLVITTGIFYQDFEKMYSGPVLVFVIGVLITCAGVAILSYQAEENNKTVGKMLLDALNNVEAGWAKQLKEMHEKALQEKVGHRVSDFVSKLKDKVVEAKEGTVAQIEQLQDADQREQALGDIEHEDLKNVVRMLITRINKTVEAMDTLQKHRETELRRANSSVASGDVRSTALGTSVFGLGFNTSARAHVQTQRQKLHNETESIMRSLGGGASRPNSRANSAAASRSVSRPASAARSRLHEAKSTPVGGGVGQGSLHTAASVPIRSSKVVPEEGLGDNYLAHGEVHGEELKLSAIPET